MSYFGLKQKQSTSTLSLYNTSLIQQLSKRGNKKLKIVISIGPIGEGKSLLNHFIIKEIGRQLKYVQPSQQQNYQMKYYFQEFEEEDIMYVEFQNLDFSLDNEQLKDIKLFILEFFRISICVLYVHHNIRESKGFEQLANEIKQLNCQKKPIFIEILNKWNGDSIQSYSHLPIYSKLFQKVIFLKSLSFKKQQIIQNDDYQYYLTKVKEISDIIKEQNNQLVQGDVIQVLEDIQKKLQEGSNDNGVYEPIEDIYESTQESNSDFRDPLLYKPFSMKNTNQTIFSKKYLLKILFFVLNFFIWISNISTKNKIKITCFVGIFYFFWNNKWIKTIFFGIMKVLKRFVQNLIYKSRHSNNIEKT